MYYSRDCLLLFSSSWVNIISLMSWVYCREGSAHTAVVLSGVSARCSTAEEGAAAEHTGSFIAHTEGARTPDGRGLYENNNLFRKRGIEEENPACH